MIWIYKYLFDNKGPVIGGKARLVVLGDRQEFEIGELNYAAVLNDTTYRTVQSVHEPAGRLRSPRQGELGVQTEEPGHPCD